MPSIVNNEWRWCWGGVETGDKDGERQEEREQRGERDQYRWWSRAATCLCSGSKFLRAAMLDFAF